MRVSGSTLTTQPPAGVRGHVSQLHCCRHVDAAVAPLLQLYYRAILLHYRAVITLTGDYNSIGCNNPECVSSTHKFTEVSHELLLSTTQTREVAARCNPAYG